MKVIEKSREFTAAETWKMTRDAAIQKMSEIEGQSFKPIEYCVYEDTNADGKDQVLLSIMAEDGVVYATNSETFRREFLDMCNVFREAHFITCALG